MSIESAVILVLCAVSAGMILARGWLPTVPGPEGAALTGGRAAVHEEIERREALVPAGRTRDDGLWRAHLDSVERELQRGHVDAAVRAWQDAYGAALAGAGWDGMIAVGDAFMAIGRASGSIAGARLNAREAYLSALIRARRERSVEGVIRIAEAFRDLDDRAIGEQCLHIAARLAAGNEEAQQRLREAHQRWAAWQPARDPGTRAIP